MAWTKSPDQDLSSDTRGWKKHHLRQYSLRDEQRVLKIHHQLDRDASEYFSGASAILQEYQKLYPDAKSITLRFIGRTLAKHGLSTKPKVRVKGASKYLHYPKTLIENLGSSIVELDFIGKKFIDNRTEPINFIGFSLTKPRKLKHFQRVESETAAEAIKHCQRFFDTFERPEVIKVDNGFAFAGAGPQARTLNSFTLFLLKKKIIPVFTAPRKPWNQASIEGSNSIFSRKFWHRERYTSVEMIDQRLPLFNKSYQQYHGYIPPARGTRRKTPFVPMVYFIRKVYQDEQSKRAYIEILKEKIVLPKSYIGMFVLTQWNLNRDILTVLYESDQQAIIVKELNFKLNPKTRELGGSLSFVT